MQDVVCIINFINIKLVHYNVFDSWLGSSSVIIVKIQLHRIKG